MLTPLVLSSTVEARSRASSFIICPSQNITVSAQLCCPGEVSCPWSARAGEGWGQLCIALEQGQGSRQQSSPGTSVWPVALDMRVAGEPGPACFLLDWPWSRERHSPPLPCSLSSMEEGELTLSLTRSNIWESESCTLP